MGHDHSGHEHDHGHGHHHTLTAESDRRWLLASLVVIAVFMVVEAAVGILAHSLALLADSAHMLTDVASLALAIIASVIAQRPARGAFTFGFTRVDALAGQANGVTLLVLATWIGFESIQRLLNPPDVHGGLVVAVAGAGVVVNLVAAGLAGRANRASLNVQGAFAHIISDLYAFIATLIAGVVIFFTGWTRADPIASLVVAVLMVRTGIALVHASGRVFLEAAPRGLRPSNIGNMMTTVTGVDAVHDLHVWDLGASEPALSAHVVVGLGHDCHDVAAEVRRVLAEQFAITHATLQADHTHSDSPDFGDECRDFHGPEYSAAPAAVTQVPTGPEPGVGVKSVD
jgi:cobalt-zinc-cadmium efflux system protein